MSINFSSCSSFSFASFFFADFDLFLPAGTVPVSSCLSDDIAVATSGAGDVTLGIKVDDPIVVKETAPSFAKPVAVKVASGVAFLKDKAKAFTSAVSHLRAFLAWKVLQVLLSE